MLSQTRTETLLPTPRNIALGFTAREDERLTNWTVAGLQVCSRVCAEALFYSLSGRKRKVSL